MCSCYYIYLTICFNSGYHFAMWNAKGGISLKTGDFMKPVDRWKDINDVYRLRPVYIEEMKSEGLMHQFIHPPTISQ